MSRNIKNSEFAVIRNEIVRKCRPVLERMIDELSSTSYYDAADTADAYYNSELAKKFRKAGDERREIEKNAQYSDTLEILQQLDVDGVNLFVCRYIPTNMNVLVYLNNSNQCAIARVKKYELVNIKSPEILSDIAVLFNNRRPVSGNAVKSISMALKQGRSVAKDTVEKINAACGSELSWRYLFGDHSKK